MQPVLTDVLARRRDRSIAIILGLKERECDSYLPRDASVKLRKAVLDQFNEFFDFAVDILRSYDSADEGPVLNDIYLEKLDIIHDMLAASLE